MSITFPYTFRVKVQADNIHHPSHPPLTLHKHNTHNTEVLCEERAHPLCHIVARRRHSPEGHILCRLACLLHFPGRSERKYWKRKEKKIIVPQTKMSTLEPTTI
uniref:Uncharacterized protein n=1 Tax=Cacopsylla melanoneura TaxID=428564 RepID=A0A8D9BGW1_9HEMI